MPVDDARRRKIAVLQGLIDSVPGDFRLDGPSAERAGEAGEAFPSRRDGMDAADSCTRSGAASGEPRGHGGEKGSLLGESVAACPGARATRLAYRRIVELCGYHEFCRAKLRQRLLREGLPPAAVEEGLAEAVRVGLVDDFRWGEMRAAALMRKGAGNGRIVRELRENGIDPACIEGWPRELEARYGIEFDRALAQLRKNPPRSRNPRASAYGRLLRKGYSPDVARRACDAWLAETAAPGGEA